MVFFIKYMILKMFFIFRTVPDNIKKCWRKLEHPGESNEDFNLCFLCNLLQHNLICYITKIACLTFVLPALLCFINFFIK